MLVLASRAVTTSPSPAVRPTAGLVFRPAVVADLPRVVELIADDAIARARTGEVGPEHEAAFAAIDADPNNALVVVERGGEVVGTMQLTVVRGSRAAVRRGCWSRPSGSTGGCEGRASAAP